MSLGRLNEAAMRPMPRSLRTPFMPVRSAVGPLFSVAILAACSGASCSVTSREDFAPSTSGPDASGGAAVGDFAGAPDGSATADGPSDTCAAKEVAARRAEVDIIIAIDNSGSMGEEVAQVQQNINAFAQSIGTRGLDYRVILVTGATGPGTPLPGFPDLGICVPPPLGGPDCNDNAPIFRHIKRPVSSRNVLPILLSTYSSTWNQWARITANKVFIVVTDDDSELPYGDFDRQLLAKAPTGMFGTSQARRYTYNAICGWEDGTPLLSATKCSTAANIGREHQELSRLTGGIVDSVCKTNYGGVFDNLATGLATKLGCEFAVPTSQDANAADPSKVVVQYTPGIGPRKGATTPLTRLTDASKCALVPDGWYYDDDLAPTKILLCPTTCADADADPTGKISILLGCKRTVPR